MRGRDRDRGKDRKKGGVGKQCQVFWVWV